MVTSVKKWGNSLALRIPSALAKVMNFRQGSLVEVSIVEGKMIVRPKKRLIITLSYLLKGITKNNRHSGLWP